MGTLPGIPSTTAPTPEAEPTLQTNPQELLPQGTPDAESEKAAPQESPTLHVQVFGDKEPVVDPNAEIGTVANPGAVKAEDDAESDYLMHVEDSADSMEASRADQLFGDPLPRETAKSKLPASVAKKLPESQQSKAQGVTMDILKGTAQAPSQMVGGARDAIQSAINGLGDVANAVTEKLPDFFQAGLVSDEDGIRILGKEDYAKWKEKTGYKHTSVQLPEVKKSDTVTGNLIRGVSQFLTGFIPAGRAAKALGIVGKAGATTTAGKAALSAGQGFAADFAAFEGHDQNLANLVEQFPSLKNPVTEFLATSPEDSEAVGRLKNAITGLVPGVAIDGFMGAVSAIRSFRAAKAAGATADSGAEAGVAAAAAGETIGKEVTETELHTLGDPKGKLFIDESAQSKLAAAEEAVKDLKPSDTRGKVGKGAEFPVNFAAINNAEDVRTVIRKLGQKWKGKLEEAQRGKRSHAVTKLSADQENAWELMVKRRSGDALNAEETVALRELWVNSAEKLKEMASLATRNPTPANLYNFRKMASVYYAVKMETMGARAEAGRALEAWKIQVGGKSSKEMATQLDELFDMHGGSEVTVEMANKIARLAGSTEAGKIDKIIEGGLWTKTKEAFAQVFMFNLLSGPASHVKNMLSNFSFSTMGIGERRAAAYLSQKLGTEGGVQAGEAMAMAHAMTMTFREAIVALSKQLRTEPMGVFKKSWDFFSKDTVNAIEAGTMKHEATQGALTPERWGFASSSPMGRALDLMDVVTRTPNRLLGKMDMSFQGLAHRMELHAQAVRLASQEVHSGKITKEMYAQRVAEIIETPPKHIESAVATEKAYRTLTNKPADWPNKMATLFQKIPIAGRLFLPFKNTPINETMAALERTPMAPLLHGFRSDLAAGGARRDMALAKMATGTMVMATITDLAMSGLITGKGPKDPAARSHFSRNKQPYSVKIGGKWVNYNSLGPVGTVMGIAADYAEAVLNVDESVGEEKFQRVFVATAFALTNNIMNKGYMQGITNLAAAIVDPDKNAWQLYLKTISAAVPSGVAAIARMNDPYLRIAQDEVDALRRRSPLLSEGVPLYRDLWGRTVNYQSEMGAAYDLFSPVWMKTDSPEPIDQELEKIKYFPDMPDKRVMFNGVPLDLSAKQYSRYVHLAGNEAKDPMFGQGAKDYLNDLVTGKHPFSEIYDIARGRDQEDGGSRARDQIQKVINDFRDRAKKQLMGEDTDLQAAYDEKTKLMPGKIPASILYGQ